jgi:hypothetical protein
VMTFVASLCVALPSQMSLLSNLIALFVHIFIAKFEASNISKNTALFAGNAQKNYNLTSSNKPF